MSSFYIGQMRTGTKALLGGAVITVAALAVLVVPVVLSVAPHAQADADSYLNCKNGIPGDTDAKLALGREAYNATGRNRSRAAYEGLALMQKYNLSESVASRIAGCAVYYGPF